MYDPDARFLDGSGTVEWVQHAGGVKKIFWGRHRATWGMIVNIQRMNKGMSGITRNQGTSFNPSQSYQWHQLPIRRQQHPQRAQRTSR